LAAEGNLAPDPGASPDQSVTTLWEAPLTGGAPRKIAEGDAPAISSRGQLAFTKDDHVWTMRRMAQPPSDCSSIEGRTASCTGRPTEAGSRSCRIAAIILS